MNPESVYEQLLGYAMEARKDGYVIVCDAFEVGKGEYKRDGCCALGAYNRFAKDGERLGLPEGEELASAWDAIEYGFDGMARHPSWPFEWWRVGARLRDALRPIPADRLLAREPTPRPVRIRFT